MELLLSENYRENDWQRSLHFLKYPTRMTKLHGWFHTENSIFESLNED